ncbi:MAG: hypothetical protein UDM29_02795, partial [Dialister sp.]|nr:hypothetical protein [Dialister sp.]
PSYSGIRSSFAESAAVINQSLLWFVLDLESLCKLKKILFTQTILHSRFDLSNHCPPNRE